METVRNGFLGVVDSVFRPLNAEHKLKNHSDNISITDENAGDGSSSVGGMELNQDGMNLSSTTNTVTENTARILIVLLDIFSLYL